MSTKLTYTGAEVQELLDKIGKGDFDNAKMLEGHPASYFAVASELTSLAESFATEQGRINTLYSYFNNGSANDALSLGGQHPSYYATALQYEILQQTLTDFKSLFDSMFEKDIDGNIHAKLSLWSSGGMTAGGAGSGSTGGGGGISYNRLDSWADYSVDKAGYVLSALLGKDLDDRVSTLANAGYITASYLAPYALRSEIPSLVGYATQSWVGENYLSKSGGKLVYSGAQGLEAERTDGAPSHIMFIGLVNGTSRQLGGFGMNGYNDPVYVNPNGIRHKVLTAENYTDYALSKNGGTISDLIIDRNPSVIQYKKNGASVGYLGIGSELEPVVYNAEGNTAYMILHSGNYSNLLAGGTINGSLTATSFIGNLTGNAGSADFVAKTYANENINFARDESKIRLVSGAASNSTDLGFPKQYTAGLSVVSSYCGWQMVCYGSNIDYNPYYRSVTDKGVWGYWRQIAFLTDNVASATKLQTSRSIWGQSFDGTENITHGFRSLYADSYNGGVAHSILNNQGAPYGLLTRILGNGSVSLQAQREANDAECFNLLLNHLGGNVAIGGTTASEKLHVHGNGKFTGGVTASSLTIGGVTLTYDSANEALCINGNMYALGGITAGSSGISAYTSLEARVARLEQQLNIS